MSEPAFIVRSVASLLSGYAYRFADEKQLHDAIAAALSSEGINFRRERGLDAKSIPDFTLDDGVLIEVKIAGSLSEALRQVDRYCVFREVAGCVLATSARWGRMPLRQKPTLRGKPFTMVFLPRQSL
jgi:hypothetical protein